MKPTLNNMIQERRSDFLRKSPNNRSQKHELFWMLKRVTAKTIFLFLVKTIQGRTQRWEKCLRTIAFRTFCVSTECCLLSRLKNCTYLFRAGKRYTGCWKRNPCWNFPKSDLPPLPRQLLPGFQLLPPSAPPESQCLNHHLLLPRRKFHPAIFLSHPWI